jgi:hypothetical protein
MWDEAELRGHWEHKDVEKAAKKAGVPLPTPTEDNMYRATTVLVEDAAPAAAPVAGAPQAIPAATGGPVAVAGDPVALAGDAKQPLAVRAAAALKIKNDTSRKLTSNDRKLISEVQKLAKAAGTTIEDLGASAGDISNVVAAPVSAAPAAPVASAPGASAPAAAAAPSVGANLMAAKELERRGAAKEIKLTSVDRKAISAAKKAAADAGLDWDNLDAAAAAQVAVAAPVEADPVPAGATADAVPVVAQPTSSPTGPGSAASGIEAQIAAAKDLERRGAAKEIKLTGEQRKTISAAKKAAADAGIEW